MFCPGDLILHKRQRQILSSPALNKHTHAVVTAQPGHTQACRTTHRSAIPAAPPDMPACRHQRRTAGRRAAGMSASVTECHG
jgi:hypothetical protein